MHSLSAYDTLRLCLALALMLGLGRIFAIISQRLQQPAVLGEILAGIVLGPTLLGLVWPEAFAFFFPRQGPGSPFLNSVLTEARTPFKYLPFLSLIRSVPYARKYM